MTDTDLSAWLLTMEAAMRIGCSTRTVERLGRAKKLEQRLRPQKGSPPVVVYNPDDVARIAAERRREPPPFVLPAGPAKAGHYVPTNGNGSGRQTAELTKSSFLNNPGEDPVRQLATAFQRFLLSPPSPPKAAAVAEVAETLYVTVKDAAAILGLPQADVQRLIHDGDLDHRLTGRGGIRIRRKDLETL